jgi:prepilin signal peptidase PulO-like enzyme (type II secretory pathway)
MAIGAWTTPMFIVRLGIFSILVGAVVGAFVVWKQKGFKKGGTRMPFAPAFLCGVFLIKVFELKGWSIL